MQILLIMMFIFFSTTMIFFSVNPIFIGASLFMGSLVSTILVGSLLNSWYAFILFLVYITGLLVLFGYLLALSPNNFQMMEKGFKWISIFVIILSLWWIVHAAGFLSFGSDVSTDFEWEVISVYKGYNLSYYCIFIILLLVVLVLVVNMVYKSPAPLRSYL